ncbi:hypothetical protein MTO96_030669 [Rhipicephalus appendiculatus]
MIHFSELVLPCVFLILVHSASVLTHSPQAVADDVPDAFKVFGLFPHIVAISDVDNDTVFECLSAKRTEYDPEG